MLVYIIILNGRRKYSGHASTTQLAVMFKYMFYEGMRRCRLLPVLVKNGEFCTHIKDRDVFSVRTIEHTSEIF